MRSHRKGGFRCFTANGHSGVIGVLERGDSFVYVLIVLLLVAWAWYFAKKRRGLSSDTIPSSGKLVELLKEEGYDIVSGKTKIPVKVDIGDRETDVIMSVDCIVRQNGRKYVVKVEREEGEAVTVRRVRERFLAVCLAFQADGIVVVSADKTRIKHVDIALRSSFKLHRLRWGVVSFLLGVGLTFFWLY